MALLFSVVLMIFLALGTVCASDSINVSDTEDSNLMGDNVNALSTNDKLEVSNEDSISQANIVNSHDDNLGDCPDDQQNISADVDCEDDIQPTSDILEAENDTEPYEISDDSIVEEASSNDEVIAEITSDDVVVAETPADANIVASSSSGSTFLAAKTSTKLVVDDTHYKKSATYFRVTLTDKNGKALTNAKVSLKVNGKTYSANTNSKGIASIKTASLAVGTYAVTVSYSGNSKYGSSSITKKVKVLSSVIGSDLTKRYGYASVYKATFWKCNSVLANTKVSFKLHGKTYSSTTDKNGVAKVKISGYLVVGKYSITTTNPYSKEKASDKIVVKKSSSVISHSNKTYIIPNHKYAYTVTLKSKLDLALKKQKVSFTYNQKTVTSKTDANGKATITIPVLAKGTYKISYKFDGSNNFYGSSGEGVLIVKDPTTKLSASALKMKYNDGSKFKVKLTDAAGKNLTNKQVKFKIDGKGYTRTTNSKGIAILTITDVNPGTHKIAYSHSTRGLNNYNYGVSKVVISKSVAVISAKDLTMKYKDGSSYQVTVKDKSGKPLKDIYVNSTIGGKSYIYETNANGVAKLKMKQGIGYYPIKTVLSDPRYNSNTVSKHVLVDGTKFVAKNLLVSVGKSATFSVKLLNGKSKPIKNAKVKFTIKGKTLTSKTDSKGIAKVKLGVLSKGTHKIKYTQRTYSGTSKIYVLNKVSLKNIIAASQSVKSYISKNHKLPSSVKVGNMKLSTAQYLYLASKAIVNIKSGSKASIAVKSVKNPSSPKAAANLGNLYDYLSVAKSIVKTVDSKGKMPNSVSSKVGTIGYKGLVSAFSRVVAFYDDNAVMPAYVAIKTLSSSSSSSSTSNLNSKNTISNLAKYLASSTHCQVNNAKIKALVAKLTKDCTTNKQKAVKIYNYVRDTISYSFYYDTKYGAVGTLNAKTGNCVDHSHLLVAMFRTAKLPARYVHGTCAFSSGGVYGHVWTQVLIGDTWTVADATSSRNSFGNVVNWNSHSYSLHGYYSSIAF